MRTFIKRYGYEVSNTTMHKYMNKRLNLCAIIMHSKPFGEIFVVPQNKQSILQYVYGMSG